MLIIFMTGPLQHKQAKISSSCVVLFIYLSQKSNKWLLFVVKLKSKEVIKIQYCSKADNNVKQPLRELNYASL